MKIEANRNLFSRILCMVLVLMIILACAGCGNAEDASSATGGTEPIGGGEYDVVGKSDKEPTLEELQKELTIFRRSSMRTAMETASSSSFLSSSSSSVGRTMRFCTIP